MKACCGWWSMQSLTKACMHGTPQSNQGLSHARDQPTLNHDADVRHTKCVNVCAGCCVLQTLSLYFSRVCLVEEPTVMEWNGSISEERLGSISVFGMSKKVEAVGSIPVFG